MQGQPHIQSAGSKSHLKKQIVLARRAHARRQNGCGCYRTMLGVSSRFEYRQCICTTPVCPVAVTTMSASILAMGVSSPLLMLMYSVVGPSTYNFMLMLSPRDVVTNCTSPAAPPPRTHHHEYKLAVCPSVHFFPKWRAGHAESAEIELKRAL